VLLDSPDHDLVGAEPIYWDGEPVGVVRVGAYGYTLGASCGIADVEREESIKASDIAAGSFEIDIAGVRVPAKASLKPFFDPERSRPLS